MIMDLLGPLMGLAGGLGLSIYGMQLCSEGLQKLAAHQLKRIVKKLTNTPLVGLLVGALVTFGVQGSNATTGLVVGFVSAGIMSLEQALRVLLGSAIGTSLTVQFIAFQMTGFSLLLLFAGAILYLFSKRRRIKNIGQAVLGFGLLVYGLSVMSAAMIPIKDFPVVARTLVRLEAYPLLEFLVATLLTALIQSSPAFLALLMSLAINHLISVDAIIPFVLGAHLGGTVTGVISCIGAPGRDAKRAAIANFAFKLLNALVFLPFYRPLGALALGSAPSDVSRVIANAHTFFSVAMAIGLLPLAGIVAELMKRLIPDRQQELAEALYLDETLLEIPDLAVDQARQQTIAMGRLVREKMLDRVLPALQQGDEESIDRIIETDRAVDSLYKKVSKYVTSIGNNQLPEELMQKCIQILYVANDLEHVGDIVVSIARTARKIHYQELEFSAEGRIELETMFTQAYENLILSLQAFEFEDREMATRVIKEHPKMQRLEKELRYNHFERMQCGNQKTIATSAIHLDLVESLLRMDGHAVNNAQGVLGIV